MLGILKRLSLKVKLLLFSIMIALVSISVVGLISYQKSKQALAELSISQLESQGTMMKNNLKAYLDRSRNFTAKLSRDRLVEGLFIAYEGNFFGAGFDPSEDVELYNELYKRLDQVYLERKNKILTEFEIEDFFLVSLDSQIIFSANNTNYLPYLGKNLNLGVYKDSLLQKCYSQALSGADGETHFSGFFYNKVAASTDAFLCSKKVAEFDNGNEGITKGDQLGVLIVKLDTKKINSIMTQRVGMGETGQAYMVGSDFKLRSDFFLQADKYNTKNSLNSNLNVQTTSIEKALDGITGSQFITDVLGEEVISFHTPIEFMGNKYAVIAEKRESEVFSEVTQMLIFIAISSLVLGLFVIAIAMYIINVIINPITKANEHLKDIASYLDEGSQGLKDNSGKLTTGAENLAGSLQETTATMNEFTAMVEQNLSNVQESTQSSVEMTKSAEDGKAQVNQMLNAMNDISLNNDSVVDTMNDIVAQMTEFKDVIDEIGKKTNVINDIVFQTKLLSFNASVEAARAGEQGKGFAVVAEEVGNLATASGKSATEITNLLQENIEKVQSMVTDTVRKVDQIKETGTQKVQQGKQTADQCEKALSDIVSKIEILTSKIHEIDAASNEQAKGISEITNAMTSLDQVANQTAAIAAENSSSSGEFSQKSTQLNQIFIQLNELVNGLSEKLVAQEQPTNKTPLALAKGNKLEDEDRFVDFDVDDVAND
ncbi:MAG: methyl-accepting chemotaxis protein [Bacteriovoracaceae bacterium]|nr:methyl-accepting chemotaxis protein [Bacteriovoracaceae bacterium]